MNNNKSPCVHCSTVKEDLAKLTEKVEEHDEKLKEHDERLDEHEKNLYDSASQFAVINYKLNLIMGVLGAIGVSVLGVIINIMFG